MKVWPHKLRQKGWDEHKRFGWAYGQQVQRLRTWYAGVRCIVTLECTEARAEGGTPSRYTTQKVRLDRLICSQISQIRRMIAVFLHQFQSRLQMSRQMSCPRRQNLLGHGKDITRFHKHGRGHGQDAADKHSYVQNRRKTSERLELKKYNKFLRRHTLHKVCAFTASLRTSKAASPCWILWKKLSKEQFLWWNSAGYLSKLPKVRHPLSVRGIVPLIWSSMELLLMPPKVQLQKVYPL